MANETDIIQVLKNKKKLDIGLLSDADNPSIVTDFIPTGCLPLDRIMGGGLAVGRMTEFYGENSSGKSLVAAMIAAVAQTMDNIVVAYVDTEAAVSMGQMRRIGVDPDRLVYASPDTDEAVFELLDNLLDEVDKSGQRLVFIWDSVAATSSKAELEKVDEKGFGETGYLNHARVISQSMRVVMRKVAKSQAALLFLNQTREKIGVMYGDKISTFGGRAISFHASVRVELSLFSKLKSTGANGKKGVIGVLTNALCKKNRIVAPYQTAQLPIYFGYGVNDAEACRLWLRDAGYITGSSWQTIMLGGQAVKFQLPGWVDVYQSNYEAIAEIILANDQNDREIGEIDNEDAD